MEILDMFCLKVFTPVLDRFSPLSYAIADYIHRVVAKHRGYETCFRESLNYVFIIQAMGLFKEISDDCIKCTKLRKKYLEVSMGPIADEQLVIAPPFWIAMCDIFGPCQVYVPGHSMLSRNKQAVDVKCYVLVFVCLVTKLVNMQVIETKKTDGVIDGINRLGCEVGIPSFVLVDQDSSIIKALNEAEVNLKDLQHVLYKEKGIKFKTCPVSGHNMHGAVERKIRSVQECLERADVANMRLHATGYQTFVKLAENDINNLPMGYAYGRDSDNSPILKLIFPNMMKIGRSNKRAIDGPVRMPKGPGELMKRVEQAYNSFYKLWNTAIVPKLMKQNKWYDSKAELQVNDLVYFKKEESELSSRWTVGKITEVIHSKDGQVRRATVQYQNANEKEFRLTDRAARSLVKLFHIDDENWTDDMAEVEKLVEKIQNDKESNTKLRSNYKMSHVGVEGDLKFKLTAAVVGGVQSDPGGVDPGQLGAKLDAWVAKKRCCKQCCCAPHCSLTGHARGDVNCFDVKEVATMVQRFEFPDMFDRAWLDSEQYEEELVQAQGLHDGLTAVLCGVNLQLGDDTAQFNSD